jgi:hypothetical protein
MKPVIKADPVYRRQFLWTLGLACAVGSVVIWRSESYFRDWQAELSRPVAPERMAQMVSQLSLGALVVYGLMWAGALALFRDGLRIRRAGQFPPPGAKVLRDTPVIEGDIARLRATMLMVSAVLLGFCLVVVGLMGVQLLFALKR